MTSCGRQFEPLLPVKPARTPGPPQMDPRPVLQGILFVLITGIGWEDLPQELGFGFRDDLLAQAAQLAGRRGIRTDLRGVLARCHAARLIDFDRVMVDRSHVRAKN
ncbi:transposase [Nocardia sp. NPDC004711]